MSNTRVMPTEVATVTIFTPFNFTVSLSSRNSRIKGHANIKGFTVTHVALEKRPLIESVNLFTSDSRLPQSHLEIAAYCYACSRMVGRSVCVSVHVSVC